MHTSSSPIRRSLTVIVAGAAIMLGFTAIQVASAWTADAAPLVASPASAASLESKLADERARSTDLQERLTGIVHETDDMAAALQAAQDRIAADAAQAEQLTSDLAKANAKLKALEATIKKAAAAVRTRTVTKVSTATSASGTTSHHDDDDEEGGDD
jgi:peptidoglycan hydrolase CwlO-like protein